MKRIYADHNATTPLDPAVLEAMLPYLREHFGNASSVHVFGREARAAVDDARVRVAKLLGAQEGEIVFTGGGTEADNMAVFGVARALRKKGPAHCDQQHRTPRGAARLPVSRKDGRVRGHVSACEPLIAWSIPTICGRRSATTRCSCR